MRVRVIEIERFDWDRGWCQSVVLTPLPTIAPEYYTAEIEVIPPAIPQCWVPFVAFPHREAA